MCRRVVFVTGLVMLVLAFVAQPCTRHHDRQQMVVQIARKAFQI
jgi:hypothetical protein